MANGIVKFFNAAKGFGFITPEGEGKDVFVMATAVTQSGMSGLKPGQRLSFETVPDTKGPKAVNLKLLAEAPVMKPPSPRNGAATAEPYNLEVRHQEPRYQEASHQLTVFVDPSQDESDVVLDALAACGQQAQVVDYITTPPSRDQLKDLSVLMRGSDRSLVRKYDPLFRELSLDDRFIGDNEFWTAIFEHPTLINGPVLAMGSQVRACRNEADVRAFFGLSGPAPAAKPKTISSRLAALVNGHAVPVETKAEAAPVKQTMAPVQAVQPAIQAPVMESKIKAKVAIETKPVAKSLPQAIKSPAKPSKSVKMSKPAAKKPAPVQKTSAQKTSVQKIKAKAKAKK